MLRFDSRFVLSLSAFSFVSLAIFACSSPAVPESDLDNDTSGSKNGKNGSNKNNTSGNDSETPNNNNNNNNNNNDSDSGSNPPPANECAAKDEEACVACCEQGKDLEKAFGAAAQAFGDCACGGPCATQCGNNYCNGQDPTPACETCLDGATQCDQQADAICEANADCKAITACYDTCPSGGN